MINLLLICFEVEVDSKIFSCFCTHNDVKKVAIANFTFAAATFSHCLIKSLRLIQFVCQKCNRRTQTHDESYKYNAACKRSVEHDFTFDLKDC